VDIGGSYSNNFWDTETSGQTSSAAGTGKTTAQMMAQATFSGWDFGSTWDIVEGETYPYHQYLINKSYRFIKIFSRAADQ